LTGVSFPEGGGHFRQVDISPLSSALLTGSFLSIYFLRWCQSYPDYFAISAQSPVKGAVIHVHNMAFAHAQPNVITIASSPHHIRDFDFLASSGIPRIVAAVGRDVIIFPIAAEA